MDSEDTITKPARRRSSSLLQHSRRSQGHYRLPSDIPEAGDEEQHKDTEPNTRSSSSDWEMDDIDDFRSDEGSDDDEETGLAKQERSKRRGRKRRNTLIDERIAQSNIITKEEKRLADHNFWRASIINVILIGLWYTFSISISVYNKWMFSEENLNFHFPLFTTSLHMVVQFILASTVLFFFPSLRPQRPVDYAPVPQSANEDNKDVPKRPLMTWWFYLTRIGPCGAATGMDIGLGNTSLKFISLTFYTMCKSSVLAFVLLFAFLFRLEKPSLRLGAIIVCMTVGVVMMVAGETAFNAAGFILVMSAAFFSGFRWSLTQILLLRNPTTSNPFSTLFFLTPVMFLAIFIIAVPAEGPLEIREGFRALTEERGLAGGICILLFPGLLAFLMTASEFALLKRTSVVTLSVCGIFKEVLTISAAGLVFGDTLTPINISGLVVTISSIAAYNYIKITKMKEGAQRDAQQQLAAEGPVLSVAERQDSITGGERDSVRRGSSTAGMIKNGLSLPVKPSLDFGKDRSAASPVKKRENLD